MGRMYHIIEKGNTIYNILIAEDAPESLRVASHFLQIMIKHCTTVQMGITVTESAPFISIGQTKAYKRLGHTGDKKELSGDAFKILFQEGNIYLYGATERGTVYAVNDFLERYFGVRFLTAQETYAPKNTNIGIDARNVIEIPSFKSRCFYASNISKDAKFASKMRMVAPFMNQASTAIFGGGFEDEWNTSWMHTMQEYMPRKKYYKNHPEWYASDNDRAWLCLTNGLTNNGEDTYDAESCLSVMTDILLKEIQDKPTRKYFMLGHQDSSEYCQCERCKTSRAINKTVSGYLMVWINAIARRIEEWRKQHCPNREIFLVSFAYLDSLEPPVYIENEEGKGKAVCYLEREYWAPLKVRKGKIIPINSKVVPENNVVIFCAGISTCYMHTMDNLKCDWNQINAFALEGWRALGAKLMIWYYGVDYINHLWWFPNRLTMKSHLEFYKKFEPLFILHQGAPREDGFYQGILHSYLLSKLMWNTTLDLDQLTQEFNRCYFGEDIAKYVDEFIQAMERHYCELNKKYDGKYHSDIYENFEISYKAENFSYHFLTACIERLRQALDKTDNESVKMKIKRVLIQPLYMLAYNAKNYSNFDLKYLEELKKYLQETGVCHLNEGNLTPQAFIRDIEISMQA